MSDGDVAYQWPCALRTAHGPHRPTQATLTDRQIAEHGGNCPGVGAHPATMIGRAS